VRYQNELQAARANEDVSDEGGGDEENQEPEVVGGTD
jgi:hypothetical protein